MLADSALEESLTTVNCFASSWPKRKTRLLHEVIALVALAVGALFTLSFLCIAIIASAWGTPYFLSVVWGVAATWLVVTIAAFLVLRTQRPGQSFQTLQQELQRDVESVKEAIK